MSNLIASAMHDINRARLKLEVARNDCKLAAPRDLLSRYINKLQWITTDFLAQHYWRDDTRLGLSRDLRSDCLTSEAVMQKLDYLCAHDREQIENLIDALVQARKEAGAKFNQSIK